MLRQWDIVGVPGDMWPWDESASDFFAVIISSAWAREKAGIFWFCPIREGMHRVAAEGSVPIIQIAHRERAPNSWRRSLFASQNSTAGAPVLRSEYVKIPYERPIARMDLMITGGRHELLPWDCGTVDKTARTLLRKELRKFVGI